MGKQHTRDLLSQMVDRKAAAPAVAVAGGKSKLIPVNMRLKESDYELLKQFADRQGISVSGAIRMSISRFLDAEGVR